MKHRPSNMSLSPKITGSMPSRQLNSLAESNAKSQSNKYLKGPILIHFEILPYTIDTFIKISISTYYHKSTAMCHLQQLPAELYINILSDLFLDKDHDAILNFLIADGKATEIFRNYLGYRLDAICIELQQSLYDEYFTASEKLFQHPTRVRPDEKSYCEMGLQKIDQLAAWMNLRAIYVGKSNRDWRWKELQRRAKEGAYEINTGNGWNIDTEPVE
ncbi:hypothetical protein EDC01DRAFT_667336 [Geopyxis carbonaria]|nr:hypothetical protein EDC01DRAFT_667336 [Geopyxis carbonaria]